MRLLLTLTVVAGLMAAGCGRNTASDAASTAQVHPRLVVFSPALSRMVFDMGLGAHVVGVTTHAQLPDGVDLPRVGNALSIRAEPILAVAPDAILTQIDASNFEAVVRLDDSIRIESFRIERLDDIPEAMIRLGKLVGLEPVGRRHADAFIAALDKVRQCTAGLPKRRAICVLGYNHASVAGGGTFVSDLIEVAGGINVAADMYTGWKEITTEDVLAMAPEVIICQVPTADVNRARQYWQQVGTTRHSRVKTIGVPSAIAGKSTRQSAPVSGASCGRFPPAQPVCVRGGRLTMAHMSSTAYTRSHTASRRGPACLTTTSGTDLQLCGYTTNGGDAWSVYVTDDMSWTIPAGHLATVAWELASVLHGDSLPCDESAKMNAP